MPDDSHSNRGGACFGAAGEPVVKRHHPCEPNAGTVREVRIWSLVLLVLAAFSALPALRYGNPATAPDWARWVLFVATLQGLYALWMAAAPDWSSVLVAGVVYGVVAVLYAAAAYVNATVPAQFHLPLELEPLRVFAPKWCTAVSLLLGLCAYLCFRSAIRWYRASLRYGPTVSGSSSS